MNQHLKNIKDINEDDKLYFEWLKPKQTLITKLTKKNRIFIKQVAAKV